MLEEIGAHEVPQILVFNKLDKLGEGERAPRFDMVDGGKTPRVWTSAVTGQGLEILRETINRTLQDDRVHCWLHVPDENGRLRARLFEQGLVANERAADSGWDIEIDAPRSRLEPLFGTADGAWLRAQLAPGGDAAH